MTDEEKIAAEKAKAESEQKTERTFTQADMDLAMAKVRRDEKRKASSSRWSLVLVSMLCVSASGLRA